MKYEQIQNAIIKAINSNIHKAAGKQFFITMGSNTDKFSVYGVAELNFNTIAERREFDIDSYDLVVVDMFNGNLNDNEYSDSLFGMIDYVASYGGYISIGNDMYDMDNIYTREFNKATDLDELFNDDDDESENNNTVVNETESNLNSEPVENIETIETQPQNKIIELVPDASIKTQLYEVLQNNDTVGYTFNLRGIPGAIYENYDINDRLFIVINPNKLQLDYVDFYIYSIDTKIHEVYNNDDMQQLKDLYQNDYNEFIEVIKKDGATHILQYSHEDILNYFVKLFENNISDPSISETTIDQVQTEQPSHNNFALTDGYTILKEANNVQILGKIESYTSCITQETYDQVTDIKIIKDSNIIYEAYRIDFPMDAGENKININDYLNDIILYINNSNLEPYWLNIQLDKLLKQKSTIHFQIAAKQLKNDIAEKERYNKYQQEQKELEELKSNVITLANNKNMIIAIGSDHIKLLNNLKGRNIKDYQDSKTFIETLVNYKEDDKMLQPHLVKTFKPDKTIGLTYNDIDKTLLLKAKEYLNAIQ
jgi:hypothetical protein